MLELNPKMRIDNFIHSYLLKGLANINGNKSDTYFYNYIKKNKLFSFDCAHRDSWKFNSSSYFHQKNKEHKINKEVKSINRKLKKIERRQRTEKLIKIGLFFKAIELIVEEPYAFVGYLLSLNQIAKSNEYYIYLSKEVKKTDLYEKNIRLKEIKAFINLGLLFCITKLLDKDLEVLYGLIADFKAYDEEKDAFIKAGKEYYTEKKLVSRI